ncbi:MAG TPA: IlvD/Edd family dehydratase [Acidimicrobiia bacterium]|nr:IlvD/Edd family dehydratase [Acidimicrobiia bacterium]
MERDSLRSSRWFAAPGKTGYGHRAWLRNQGYPDDTFTGRPVIGICNTASDLNPCNTHLTALTQDVERGVLQEGGVPFTFPTISLGEPLMRPTAMLYRNLMSMDVEESIRANPLDGVVLLGGCDKTTPALLMGAASVDLPAILITGGPMLNGKYQGRDVGSGTDLWRFSDAVRAGRMTQQDFLTAEACMARSPGHCMTMGTASTMACLTEVMGIQLPGSAELPAVDSRRRTSAWLAGRRIVEMVSEDLKPSDVLTRHAFENAIVANAALGGSTNAILHLLALAGRLEVDLALDDFDRLAQDVPLIANVQPSGEFLMEDFYYAGGLAALLREIDDLLHLDAKTVAGTTLGAAIAEATIYDERVIRRRSAPDSRPSGTVVLRGNLCPGGAVLKRSAASPRLLQHRGRAVVFDDLEDMDGRIDEPSLDVDENSVLILRNCGPIGYPGMPEVGNIPIPTKLLQAGVEDLVRITDARMSGTSYGTVILHVSPEAAAGGPLALVQDGDWVTLDVDQRTLTLEVGDEELEERRSLLQAVSVEAARGYTRLYVEHVQQADTGADFDFLVGRSGPHVPKRSF